MANLSQAERDKLPDSAFCGPKRSFPAHDEAHYQAAIRLVGRAPASQQGAIKACLRRKAKASGWDIPESWGTSDNAAGPGCRDCGATVAAFALGDRARFDGAYVERRAKISEAGEYPDKDLDLTPEDFMFAAAEFAPVPLDLEHVPSVLDGKLGELVAVEQSEDGRELYGTVRLPSWLDEQLKGTETKVSAAWDRATKTIAGLALVLNPRIADAALMAAFAASGAAKRHDTRSGQSALQMIHDTAATYGAVCDKGNAQMASRHEATALQQVHDLTTAHGASCNAMGAGERPAIYSGQGGTMADQSQTQPRSAWDWLKDTLTGKPDPASQQAAPAAQFSSAQGTQTPAPNPEVERLRAEVAKMRAEQIATRAAAFADEQVRASKALPAERDGIAAQYAQAAQDDADHGEITFSDGKKVSRVGLLAASFEARQPHGLTQEQVRLAKSATQLPTQETTRFANAPKPGDPKAVTPEGQEPDEARIAYLASLNPSVAKAYAARNGQQK